MPNEVMTIQSIDGNLELVLCPAAVELRLSPKAAQQFDEACEAQKSASWLPLWRQLKGALVSAAQAMSHQVADKLRMIPLEAITDVRYSDGRIEVRTADGNQLGGHFKIGMGNFSLEYHLDKARIFDKKDARAFAERFAEVQPLYAEYLARLRQRGP